MINWPAIYLLSVLAAAAGGGWFGFDYANKQYAEQELARKSGWADALQATAAEIAKIKVTNKTTTINAEKVIERETRYKDCVNTPAMINEVNAALKGGAK